MAARLMDKTSIDLFKVSLLLFSFSLLAEFDFDRRVCAAAGTRCARLLEEFG